MRKITNLLIFPGGTEIGMEIFRSLALDKNYRVFSASSAVGNHAPFLYNNHLVLPPIKDAGFKAALQKLVKENNIDIIYPSNDHIIDKLLELRNELPVTMILPESDMVVTCRSKLKTYKLFEGIIDCPVIYKTEEEIEKHLPVFCKPDDGYGAQGAMKISSMKEYQELKQQFPKLIANELLTGNEYTIDCFSNKKGELLYCRGRERARIRMGTSMSAEFLPVELDEQLTVMAEKIVAKLGIWGAWFFQVKADANGKLKLLEVEPRIAGTMCWNRVQGINFAALNILECLDKPYKVLVNKQSIKLDRALVNRFQFDYTIKKVYIDLDDTIVIHGKLNLEMMRFLYQCINNKCKIILLSKSLETDRLGYLKKWKIAEVFDEIYWMHESESKADYIKDTDGAIFIDDSFSQRTEVAERHNIPTFDPSMTEGLIDYRL